MAIWAVETAPGAWDVDCTKVQLSTAVMARAPMPEARVRRLLLIVLMVFSFGDAVICPMHFIVVLVLYMTTSLH